MPSPAAKPGPIHGMGRAVRYRAHALSGLASAKRNADDEHSSTIARTFFQRPAQAGNGWSARDSDHEDMRMSRWRGVSKSIGPLLAAHHRAAEVAYAPGGHGYHAARESFEGLVCKECKD